MHLLGSVFLPDALFKNNFQQLFDPFGRQKRAWSVVSEFVHNSTDEEARLVELWIETLLAASVQREAMRWLVKHTSQLFCPLAFHSAFLHSGIHRFVCVSTWACCWQGFH